MTDQKHAAKWHVQQTLMGFGDGPDKNRRMICHGFETIATFNQNMNEFHDDKALQALVDYLNKQSD